MTKKKNNAYTLGEMEQGDRFYFPNYKDKVYQHMGLTRTTQRAYYQLNGWAHEAIKYVDVRPHLQVIFLIKVQCS